MSTLTRVEKEDVSTSEWHLALEKTRWAGNPQQYLTAKKELNDGDAGYMWHCSCGEWQPIIISQELVKVKDKNGYMVDHYKKIPNMQCRKCRH